MAQLRTVLELSVYIHRWSLMCKIIVLIELAGARYDSEK